MQGLFDFFSGKIVYRVFDGYYEMFKRSAVSNGITLGWCLQGHPIEWHDCCQGITGVWQATHTVSLLRQAKAIALVHWLHQT